MLEPLPPPPLCSPKRENFINKNIKNTTITIAIMANGPVRALPTSEIIPVCFESLEVSVPSLIKIFCNDCLSCRA